jgi:lipopolysaccharide cholinephosphotransferase
MQTPETDTEYAFSFAKLRNVNTCFASKAFIESPMNQGVFLDIYPLDLSPSEGLEERHKVIVDTLADCSAFMSRHNKYVITKHVKRASEKIYDDLDGLKYYNKIQEVATMACQNYGVDPKECDYTSLEAITFYNPDKYRMHKGIVSEYIKVPFCHMEINVPKRWHEWLTHTYGDYMKFPPVEERGIIHSGVVKAVDTPFEEARIDYIESLKNQN